MTDYLYFIVQVKVISYKNTWKMLQKYMGNAVKCYKIHVVKIMSEKWVRSSSLTLNRLMTGMNNSYRT